MSEDVKNNEVNQKSSEKVKKLTFSRFVPPDENIRVMTEEITGHHPEHMHDDFVEIAYIMTGSGKQQINGCDMRISEGDLFLINSHIAHSFTSDESCSLWVCNCIFQPTAVGLSTDDCKSFLDVAYHYLCYSVASEDTPRDYIKLSGLSGDSIPAQLSEMKREYTERESGFMQMLKADLTKLLIMIFRRYRNDTGQIQNAAVYKKLIISQTLAYMKKHYRENLTGDVLASRAYLSVNYFRSVFKEQTGCTVTDMLQKIRLSQACVLLRNTTMPVSAICNDVGYSDMKFFYKLFKESTGMTPALYRREKKGEMPPYAKA